MRNGFLSFFQSSNGEIGLGRVGGVSGLLRGVSSVLVVVVFWSFGLGLGFITIIMRGAVSSNFDFEILKKHDSEISFVVWGKPSGFGSISIIDRKKKA